MHALLAAVVLAVVPVATIDPLPPSEVGTAVTAAPTVPAPVPRRGMPGFRPRPIFPGCTAPDGARSPDWFTANLLRSAGWPEAEWQMVCQIAACESRFDPQARNRRSGTRGLMQIMPHSTPWSRSLAAHSWTADDLYLPVVNLTVAREGWEAIGQTFYGRGGWECAPRAGRAVASQPVPPVDPAAFSAAARGPV